MNALNKPSYTAIVVLAFLCLAAYSWPYKEHGYSQGEIEAVGELSMGVTPLAPTTAALMVYLYDEQGAKP